MKFLKWMKLSCKQDHDCHKAYTLRWTKSSLGSWARKNFKELFPFLARWTYEGKFFGAFLTSEKIFALFRVNFFLLFIFTHHPTKKRRKVNLWSLTMKINERTLNVHFSENYLHQCSFYKRNIEANRQSFCWFLLFNILHSILMLMSCGRGEKES